MIKSLGIIGSGIAGLTCASELLKKGYQIRIFEASNRYGGRIKKLNDFSKTRHLEAGGQTIHHPDNDYYKMAIETGAILQSGIDLVGSIYDPITQQVLSYEKFEEMYPKEANSLEDFIKDRDQEDESVLQRLQKKGYNMEFIHLYYALYGSEYGASLEKIGARGIGRYENDMPMFVSDYEIENYIHHSDILDKFFKDAIQLIEYNQEIKSIKIIDNNQVSIRNQNDQEYQFDQIICCVPITQIKKIEFYPKFDEFRQKQLDLVGMEKGGKFFIKLNKKFLNHEEDFFLPKFNHNSVWWDSSSEDESIIIGLLAKSGHERIEQIGIQQFAQEVIQTINIQYNQDLEILQIHYEDWGNTPFIEGLYSFPSYGIDDNYRQIISQPIEGKIYFAGEAYHPKYYSTIHGAFETGIEVVKQLLTQ